MSVGEVTVGLEPYEARESAALRSELRAELVARYQGAGAPRPEPPVADAEPEFFVARDGAGAPVGCAALRRYDGAVFELRRMYVRRPWRGRGVADALLRAVEQRARDRGGERTILECGTAQPEAMAFYRRRGYSLIPPFGVYADSPQSRCFGRDLGGAS